MCNISALTKGRLYFKLLQTQIGLDVLTEDEIKIVEGS